MNTPNNTPNSTTNLNNTAANNGASDKERDLNNPVPVPVNGFAVGKTPGYEQGAMPAAPSATPSRWLRRLAAQRRGRKPVENGVASEADSRARRRDKLGNPFGRIHVGVIAAMRDETTVEQSRLRLVFEDLAEDNAMLANQLADEHDHVVLAQLRRFRQREAKAYADLAALNEEVARCNAAIEARRAELEGERDEATQPDRKAILALDAPLQQAHMVAAERVALTGGNYNPVAPLSDKLDAVLRHKADDLRALAGRENVTFPEAAALHAAGLASNMATILAGLLLGTSFGVAVGLLDPEAALAGDITGILSWLLFGAFGWGFAVKIRSWLHKSFSDAGERQALGLPQSSWAPALGQSLGCALLLVGILMFIEQFGLLQLSALVNATGDGGHAVSGVGALALGATNIFFVGACAWDGWIEGRYQGSLSRITATRDGEFAEKDAQVRALPEVRNALDAIGRVSELQRQLDALETRVEEVATPFNTEIDRLETLKREPQESLSPEIELLLEDDFDNWHLAHCVWKRALDEAIEKASGGGGFWKGLWKLIFGQRRRSHNRDDRRSA